MGRSPVFLSSMMNLLVLVALLVQLVQPFSFNRAGLAGTLLSGHSPFRTDRLMRYEDEDYQASFDNPSFFPGSVEELAQDATFSVKVALISRINRMRIDVRSRLLSKERFAIRWVIHTALRLRDDEFRRIHVFIDAKYDPEKWQNVWREMAQAGYGVNKTTPAGAGSGSWKGGKGASATSASGSTSAIPTSTSEGWEPVPGWEAEYERVTISRITDEGITAQEEHAQDDLYLIYNPGILYSIY
ncbi:hypothetical protein B484DRAFT_91298 [Ochromonadaceae sp. CCMP2298]|nr:hypothetical protein B484DRAFT_91298 [Ochromonadaceae sp. CCMP2298]